MFPGVVSPTPCRRAKVEALVRLAFALRIELLFEGSDLFKVFAGYRNHVPFLAFFKA